MIIKLILFYYHYSIMKTIVTISNDYESGVSWDFWVDDISILKQESSIYAEKDHNLIELP